MLLPRIAQAVSISSLTLARLTQATTHNARSVAGHPVSKALFSTTAAFTMSQPEPGSKNKPDSEWQMQLNKEQFRILRNKGTEMPGSGEYDKFYPSDGVFACAGCGTPLYKADHKFKSGCGWPSFYDAFPGAITRTEDRSMFSTRTEITCTACGGHIGHVFKGEGFDTPTDERHCANSVSLKFHNEK
ncbi:Predicted pilin-like transcription factor [Phaffia rhodozyma]|uniref:Peptide-methionine (R)-S-oxide reductase n=1 Tax=Phaffia rhodozyma TaxID=264483 RepID=A0A0F7SS14_PHARH|nr:Predicted pilin-like transcription factor [Phaffia rhodozyma]